jgi:hypothetical protein
VGGMYYTQSDCSYFEFLLSLFTWGVLLLDRLDHPDEVHIRFRPDRQMAERQRSIRSCSNCLKIERGLVERIVELVQALVHVEDVFLIGDN